MTGHRPGILPQLPNSRQAATAATSRRPHWLPLAAAALVTVVGVAAVVLVVTIGRPGSPVTEVRGLVASEKKRFFEDPGVQEVFRKNGVHVTVEPAGSREIAQRDLTGYDFAFAAGALTAQKIIESLPNKNFNTYQPFSSPLAVASFRDIAEKLRRAGVAAPLDPDGNYYSLDMVAYLDLVNANKRWSDLGPDGYAANKSVLIFSTDVCTSNSAGMYLSLSAFLSNANTPVADEMQADRASGIVAPLFTRQGFSPNSTAERFDDYRNIGKNDVPMVMIYEHQFLDYKTRGDRSVTDDMVLMYPNPGIVAKPVLIPVKADGNKVGQLLRDNSELRRLEAEYGFRVQNGDDTRDYLAQKRIPPLPQPPNSYFDVDPPTFYLLERMIEHVGRCRKDQ